MEVGRILDVRAKRCKDGCLRASVQRVYIPENYIAEAHDDTRAIEARYNLLHKLVIRYE